MNAIVTQSTRSEILQKILATVAYNEARWIRLYVYKTPSTRLHPVRVDNTIVFIDCTINKDEVGHVDFTILDDVKECYIDYFEVRETYRKQGYGREIFSWIEHYAKRKGMKTIYLTPYESAINFWRKMGFLAASPNNDEMIKTIHPCMR